MTGMGRGFVGNSTVAFRGILPRTQSLGEAGLVANYKKPVFYERKNTEFL
jgi:hypothetical protein